MAGRRGGGVFLGNPKYSRFLSKLYKLSVSNLQRQLATVVDKSTISPHRSLARISIR